MTPRLEELEANQAKGMSSLLDGLAWLEEHSRFELARLPSYCPRANPIERVFGDVHDKCTRNHTRKRLRTLVGDVEDHLAENARGSIDCQRSTTLQKWI
jgi:transposase